MQRKLLLQICVLVLLAGMGVLTIWAPHPRYFLMLSVGFTWQALFYVSLLIYAVLFSDSLVSRCLRLRVLAWLGLIAYATYLLHEFVLGGIFGAIWSSTPVIENIPELMATLAALAVTLLVCHFSWKHFEKPLVQRGHRWKYSPDTKANQEIPVSGIAIVT